MQVREFAKPVTAKSLNESLAKRFGKRINLESFTLEQLQDARNKLRTRLSQVEVSESFDTVIKSESYQKSKMFLDVLNAEIAERGDIDEIQISEKKGSKPDYLDFDGDGNKKEPMKKALKDKKKKKVGESQLREGAEDQAEIVMAAKDMVDRVTSWMEDTAEMQTESMLELADAIRDEMGSEQSAAFVDSVKPALESLYTAMGAARESLSNGVGMLTGENPPPTEMGAEEVAPEAGAEGMEPTIPQEELGAGAPAAPAAGGEEPAGRPQRESLQRSKKKLSEADDPETSRIVRGFIQHLKTTDPQLSQEAQTLAMNTKRQTNDDKAVWAALQNHPVLGKYLNQYYATQNSGNNLATRTPQGQTNLSRMVTQSRESVTPRNLGKVLAGSKKK